MSTEGNLCIRIRRFFIIIVVVVVVVVVIIIILGLEAHGGYTFCGYAALAILGQEQKSDTKKLLVIYLNL